MRAAEVLCEGFWDRSFWTGWLLRMGCQALGAVGMPQPRDPWGKAVAKGRYAFTSPSGRFLCLTPCGGDVFVSKTLQLRLMQQATAPQDLLIACVDADVYGDDPTRAAQSVAERIHEVFPDQATARPGLWTCDAGRLTVGSVVWHVPGTAAEGVPGQQTLERLVCAALARVHPERAEAVAGWLAPREGGPGQGHKNHAWSYMAGWHAEQGCEHFYKSLWSDDTVAVALEAAIDPASLHLMQLAAT